MRTFSPVVSLRPRRLSTPLLTPFNSASDAFQLHPDIIFKAVICGVECSRAKPHPEPYLEGLKAIGAVTPELVDRCVAFEDSPTGAMAAVRAGIATVGILTAQPAAALYDVGASLCVKDFAAGELLEAISGEDSLFL